MAADVRISFRGMESSPAVEAQVQRRLAELEQVSDRISACRVTLEMGHRHHRHGNIYHVHVDLSIPGRQIIVNRESGHDHAHEDIYVALRDAFDAARRQLQEHMARVSG
ncbi:MAG: ribosome-associated translation inhibitor RaiA [Rhodospirillales bacterium]|nr:ribosome-associated translation inhibitor RaiA [Rhodospirillales bacterium]